MQLAVLQAKAPKAALAVQALSQWKEVTAFERSKWLEEKAADLFSDISGSPLNAHAAPNTTLGCQGTA